MQTLEQLITEIISMKSDRLVIEFKMCLNGQPMCSIYPEGAAYPDAVEVAETLQQALQKAWDNISDDKKKEKIIWRIQLLQRNQ